MILQSDYNIWIRTIDPRPLYSRGDPTQNRGPGYNPTLFENDAYNRANPPITAGGDRSLLSRGFVRIGLVTNYEKLEFKTKYNDAGGWTLTMQDGTPEADALRNLCYGLNNSNIFYHGGYGGITVVRDGKTIFSGSVKGFSATGDFYAENGPMVEFWGTDDTAILEERLAMVNSPGNQLAPNGNPNYSGYNYSGRQISGGLAFNNLFTPPNFQGWGNYQYGNSTTAAGQKSVSTGLRNMVVLNIGVYAPFPKTYPYTYTNPGAIYYGRTPIIYNGPGDTFSTSYTSRRIPFLFMGRASGPGNAYINNADSDGRINPPGVPNYSMRARYQTLLSKCQEICSYVEDPLDFEDLPNYRGYQFSINQDDISVAEWTGTTDVVTDIDGLRFNYREPNQNEDEVIFSDALGNIASYKYDFTQPTSTSIIAAGQGESTLRWFFTSRHPTGYKFGLKEKFIDRRDVQYGEEGPPNTLPVIRNVPNMLGAPNPIPAPVPLSAPAVNYEDMRQEIQDAIDVELRETAFITNVEIEVLETENNLYFEDFFVGDWVTVRLGANESVGQIIDATITLTKAEGEVIRITVGTQNFSNRLLLFDALNQNRNDITRIETSQ